MSLSIRYTPYALTLRSRETNDEQRGTNSGLAGWIAVAVQTETVHDTVSPLEGLKADGLPLPTPSSQVEYVDVPA